MEREPRTSKIVAQQRISAIANWTSQTKGQFALITATPVIPHENVEYVNAANAQANSSKYGYHPKGSGYHYDRSYANAG
jgi:hypothetical protein